MWFFVIIAIMNRKNEKKCNYCKYSTLIIISYHKIVPCKLLLFVSYNKSLFYFLSELTVLFEETFLWSFSFHSCLDTNQCKISMCIVYAYCFNWRCIYIHTISGERRYKKPKNDLFRIFMNCSCYIMNQIKICLADMLHVLLLKSILLY